MEPGIALLAAVVGYLIGSISFARIVARLTVPGEDISRTTFDIPGTEEQFVLESVSATSLSAREGPKAGCTTSILDMIKAALPMLAFLWLYPGENYFLIVSVAVVTGHNFPIWHKFKGGRGLSPIIGSLFVIDWIFVPISFLLSNLIGLALFRDVFLAYTGFVVLLIPWLWFRFEDPAYLLYAIAINLLFFIAMRPEIRMYWRLKRSGELSEVDFLDSLAETDVGRGIKYLRKYGIIKDGKAEAPAAEAVVPPADEASTVATKTEDIDKP